MEELDMSKLGFGLLTLAMALTLGYFLLRTWMARLQERLGHIHQATIEGWENNPFLEKLSVQTEYLVPVSGVKSTQNFTPSVDFSVKVIVAGKDSPSSKSPAQTKSPSKFDPFAPEPRHNFTISDLSPSHVLLYNRFPLVEHHVLVVTKNFERQDGLLTWRDFEAALLTLKALKGVVFFNSGPLAGASQAHRHLQVVPLRTFPNGRMPVEGLINSHKHLASSGSNVSSPSSEREEEMFTLPEYEFQHVFYGFDVPITKNMHAGNLQNKAEKLADVYARCLKQLGNTDLAKAYNLLLTKHWLFVVLRTGELALEKVRLNALAFTGSFAVRSETEYELIKASGPLKVLQSVAVAN